MMKKLMVIFLALTLLTTFSVGYAETKVDSLSGKSCGSVAYAWPAAPEETKVNSLSGESCAISATDKNLEKIQKSETEQKSEAKMDGPKIEPGTIFTVDKDLEKVQKYGY